MGNPVLRRRKDASAENDPFEIDTLVRSNAPAGGQGKNWYRYVIKQGTNKIVGYKQGTQQMVREELDEIVIHLNERRVGKFGRVHLTPRPRQPKA